MVEALEPQRQRFFKGRKDEVKAYFQEALDFIQQHQNQNNYIRCTGAYGRENAPYAPFFCPTDGGRTAQRQGDRRQQKKLTQWQDRFGAYGQKYPDLGRGESVKTGRSHIPPRVFKEVVHLSRMKEQIMTLMADSNLLNKKSKMEELGALLDKYVPASEAMRTKLKKYDKAYRELSDENTALEAELKTAQNAGREKIANKLKYGKMEQELSELHALMDNIPPEIIAAYRRHTVGLQNER